MKTLSVQLKLFLFIWSMSLHFFNKWYQVKSYIT